MISPGPGPATSTSSRPRSANTSPHSTSSTPTDAATSPTGRPATYPCRPAGFDTRLPLPGDGSAEWPGGFLPIPSSINPTRGWLANWNNKPTADYDNLDQTRYGRQDRLLEIEAAITARLADGGLISAQDMRDIATDIARTNEAGNGGIGREARFLMPYLRAALDAVPPSHQLAGQARAVLEAWDGSVFADAVTSTTREPGHVIFSRWLSEMLANTFGDELGTRIAQANANTLIHVLDDAVGGGSAVPPSRDYFLIGVGPNRVDPNVVISHSFDEALEALGPDPAAWSEVQRGFDALVHPLLPTPVGSVPVSNRGTFAQIVVLSNPRITAENILPLGQSGFIGGVPPEVPVFDHHFSDQLEFYRTFQYKPMHLFRNTQLEE